MQLNPFRVNARPSVTQDKEQWLSSMSFGGPVGKEWWEVPRKEFFSCSHTS